MINKFERIIQMLRIREWLFSKIPFMFIPLVLYISSEPSILVKKELLLCVTYFVYIFFFYGFGYAINDYSDREIDKKVGKMNIMGELSNIKSIFILMILVMGCIPFIIVNLKWQTFISIGFVYYWGAAYSIRPFRFKERGIAGLLVSSLAQRTIPLLPLLCISVDIWGVLVLCGILGFFIGLRYILIHQYQDIENDRKSGTSTYISNGNHNIAALVYLCFSVECGLLLLLWFLYTLSALSRIVLIICTIQMLMSFYTVHNLYRKNYFLSYVCVPLEDVYNFYFPLVIAFPLAIQNPIWWIFILLLILISASKMIDKWKIAIFCITHWRN